MLCSDRKMFCFVRCWANVCWCSATCWILTFVGVGLTMFGINPAADQALETGETEKLGFHANVETVSNRTQPEAS